ncbi:MAG TPA: trehalose-phosphatase [Candidatus Limnocylindrales bacterium]|nr:trehalose-phosphatase [Candidatus Limnocylindrales bacterium]
MPRLILVSNRLPITVRSERGELSVAPSMGGLATGLGDLHAAGEGLWIGWPGETWRLTEAQRRELATRLDDMRLVPVDLSAAEVERYYDGFANGVLWPILHSQLDHVPLVLRGWETYRRVNERFAEVVIATAQPGDLIWIHDYQLALLPALVRARLPKAAIGFFLHVPFPPAELARVLPWRREFVEGILGASLVGLHTSADSSHLRDAAVGIAGAHAERGGVSVGGRRVRIRAHPMGVDAARWDSVARSPQVAAYLERLTEELAGRRMVVSVDRLDYTKGVLRRVLAFERLLDRNPALRGRVRLVQVAAPSREGVGAYRAYARAVDQEIGRINGRYATVADVPIHHLGRTVAQEHIVALYRAASVGLVTPLRDGMNLVAKEFAASRADGDGVLVLSEFAGAASELTGALLTNPYDIEATAATIRRALDMPATERRRRMSLLRGQVRRADLRHWADAFMASLRDSAASQGGLARRPSSASDADAGAGAEARAGTDRSRAEDGHPADLHAGSVPIPFGIATGVSSPEELAGALLAPEVRSLVVVLDYDGTLVAFQDRPAAARPDPALHELLERLAGLPGITVHLVSGRRRSELDGWFRGLPVGLHAEHGLWSRPPDQEAWRRRREAQPPWFGTIRTLLDAAARDVPGSHVEVKDASLAWHWRAAAADLAEPRARRLAARLRKATSELEAELLEGDHVLEVRPDDIDKGLVVRDSLGGDPDERALIIGDDATDEDMFGVARPRDMSVHVGGGPSRAAFRLSGPTDVRALLQAVAQAWAHRVGEEVSPPRAAPAAAAVRAARPSGPRAVRSGGAPRS